MRTEPGSDYMMRRRGSEAWGLTSCLATFGFSGMGYRDKSSGRLAEGQKNKSVRDKGERFDPECQS